MTKLSIAIAVTVASMTAATISQAATFTYELGDHPDGNQAGTYDYGLRLDRENPDRFFSFGNGAQAFLTYDDDALSASISGTVIESLGNGSFGSAYTLSYELNGVTNLGGGFFVQETADSMGTLTLGTETLALGTSSNGNYYFQFANDGHRLPGSTGIAGRGWVQSNPGSNDFLFTGTLVDNPPPAPLPPVPLPAAAWMLLAGLGGLGMMGRRKKTS